MDDYYINNRNSDKLLGRLYHKSFMKYVRKAINYSSSLFCICDKMSHDYEKMFDKKCYTVHTPASFDEPLQGEKKAKISYMGNLGLKRHEQLIKIGQALKELNLDVKHIDVYSSEKREEILKGLTPDNGIMFHGSVSAEKVKEIMAESLAVIHTESFGADQRNAVKYSVSTKIADSLMSTTCIFAFGPSEIASMQYLSENNVAITAFDDMELPHKLRELLNDEDLRKNISANAGNLAKANHLTDNTPKIICEVIEGSENTNHI